jgi:hypothetical protein
MDLLVLLVRIQSMPHLMRQLGRLVLLVQKRLKPNQWDQWDQIRSKPHQMRQLGRLVLWDHLLLKPYQMGL